MEDKNENTDSEPTGKNYNWDDVEFSINGVPFKPVQLPYFGCDGTIRVPYFKPTIIQHLALRFWVQKHLRQVQN